MSTSLAEPPAVALPAVRPGAAVLVFILEPLGQRRAEHEIPAGGTIAELVARRFPAAWMPRESRPEVPQLGLIVNGRELDPTDRASWLREVQPGDRIHVYPRAGVAEGGVFAAIAATVSSALGGGALATFAGYLAATIVVGGALYGASRLLAPSVPKFDEAKRDGTKAYQFAGPETDYLPGGVIPVAFGRFPLGGQVLSYVVRNRRTRSVLYMLIGLGEGPVKGIGGYDYEVDGVGAASAPPDIKINGQDIRTFNRLRVWTRLGTLDQRPIPGFNNRERSYSTNDQKLPGGNGTAKQAEQTPVAAWTEASSFGGTAKPTSDAPPRSATYVTNAEVDAIEIGIGFPKGLYEIDSGSGDVRQVAVELRYSYLRHGDAVANASDWQHFTVRGRTTGAFTDFTDPIEMPARARYKILVQRVSANQGGLSNGDDTVLSTVNEIEYRDFSYPGHVLLAVKAESTEGLNGGRPSFWILGDWLKVPVWDGVSETTPAYTLEWTRNPAWIAFAWLRNTEWGLGGYLRAVTYDLAQWKALADESDELVHDDWPELDEQGVRLRLSLSIGDREVSLGSAAGLEPGDRLRLDEGLGSEETVTVHEILDAERVMLRTAVTAAHTSGSTVYRVHERYRWDGVIDAGSSPWEVAQAIVGTCGARIYKAGNFIGLVRAVQRPVVAEFNDGNSREVVVTYRNWRRAPNQLVGTFWNEQRNYVGDTLPVNAPNPPEETSEASYYTREEFRPQTVQLVGIVRSAQVRRHLTRELRIGREVRCSAVVKGSLAALLARIGNVVNIAHSVIAYRTVGGRTLGAVSAGGASITVDRTVVLEAATTYAIEVQADDPGQDVANIVTRTITSPAGTYQRGDTIAISGTWPADLPVRSLYAVGVSGEVTKPFEVVSYSLDPETLQIELQCEEYVEDIYADE